MYEVGRVCLKIAGRDADKYCVVLKKEGDKVLVEGQTRRKLVNPKHLEPLKQVIKVTEKSTQAEVAKELEKLGITVRLANQKTKTEKDKK